MHAARSLGVVTTTSAASPAACLTPNSTVLIGIGPPRSGTTSLAAAFRATGSAAAAFISVASAPMGGKTCCGSEIYFWNDDKEAKLGISRWCEFFQTTRQTSLMMEKTPRYTLSRQAPLNVLAHLPIARTRFVFTFRDVSSMSWSIYVHQAHYKRQTFDEYIEGEKATARELQSCIEAALSEGAVLPVIPGEALPSLVCRLSQLSRPNYHALAEQTRSCPSSELAWFANLAHWSSLVGAPSVLAASLPYALVHQADFRKALLSFTGLSAHMPEEAQDEFVYRENHMNNSIASAAATAAMSATKSRYTAQLEEAGAYFSELNAIPVDTVSDRMWVGHSGRPGDRQRTHSLVATGCAHHQLTQRPGRRAQAAARRPAHAWDWEAWAREERKVA